MAETVETVCTRIREAGYFDGNEGFQVDTIIPSCFTDQQSEMVSPPYIGEYSVILLCVT